MKRFGLMIGMILLLPVAYASGGGDVISQVLENCLSLLQSKIARLVAVIAIVGVGYATVFLGRIPKERAAAIVLGIGLIYGAGFIVEKLGYAAN